MTSDGPASRIYSLHKWGHLYHYRSGLRSKSKSNGVGGCWVRISCLYGLIPGRSRAGATGFGDGEGARKRAGDQRERRTKRRTRRLTFDAVALPKSTKWFLHVESPPPHLLLVWEWREEEGDGCTVHRGCVGIGHVWRGRSECADGLCVGQ